MRLKINIIFQYFLSIFLLFIFVARFFDGYSRNLSSVKQMFYFLFIFFTFLLITKVNQKIVTLFLIFLTYILYSIFNFMLIDANLYDYIIIFLAYFFVLGLFFFAGKEIISKKYFDKFLRVLLIAFTIRYIYMFFTNIHRPTLFIENNFELLFISILMIKSLMDSKINYYNLLMFAIITLTSGSRSGIAIFFFILFVFFFKKEYIKLKYTWLYALIIGGIFLAISIILKRMPEGGFASIDRLQFLFYFLDEINNWTWYKYTFGSPVITPLSELTCERLSWYKELFSYDGSNKCYSVIFHSFILRVIFDHGIVGLLLLFYSIKKMLSISGFSRRAIIAILGTLLLNSLSISSLNSIFAIFALMVVLIVKKNEEDIPELKKNENE